MDDEVTDTTVIQITVDWYGNYYDSAERVTMLNSWIFDALWDRDDGPTITKVEEIN